MRLLPQLGCVSFGVSLFLAFYDSMLFIFRVFRELFELICDLFYVVYRISYVFVHMFIFFFRLYDSSLSIAVRV